MAATFGTIISWIYKHIDNENSRIDFKTIVDLCTEEKLSAVVKAKTIDEKILALQNLNVDILATDIIPLVRLMLKTKPSSHENLLAYIIFSYQILFECSKIELQIAKTNDKLEEILKLTESMAITPNDLSERANWILNFKRFKLLFDEKFKNLVEYYENKELKSFENFWKKVIQKKNDEIRVYKSLYLQVKHMNNNLIDQMEYNNLEKLQFKDIQKLIYHNNKNSNYDWSQNSINKNSNKYWSQNTYGKIKTQLYIIKRMIKRNKKITNKLNIIMENSNELYEELNEQIHAKRMAILEEAINQANIEAINNRFGNNINNKNREFKNELEKHEIIWDKMKLSPIEKKANTINLKLNYIINTIENKGGTGKLNKIMESDEIISTDEEDIKDINGIKYIN